MFQMYEDGLSNLLYFLFSRKPMLNLILSMRFLHCSPAKSLRYVTRSIIMWDEQINEFMQLLGEGKKFCSPIPIEHWGQFSLVRLEEL